MFGGRGVQGEGVPPLEVAGDGVVGRGAKEAIRNHLQHLLVICVVRNISIRCVLGDIRLWGGDPPTSSGLTFIHSMSLVLVTRNSLLAPKHSIRLVKKGE